MSTESDYTMEDVTSPELIVNITADERGEFGLPEVDALSFIEFCWKLLEVTDLRLPENGAP